MVYGWTADRFGRKVTIMVAAASQLACWVILEFATNVTSLLVARFLVGFGAAGSYVVSLKMSILNSFLIIFFISRPFRCT
jgi:MFS family permease